MSIQQAKRKNFAKFQEDLQFYTFSLGLVLFLFSVVQIGSQMFAFSWRDGQIIQQFSTRTALYNLAATSKQSVQPANKPDIYYIILDLEFRQNWGRLCP